MKIIRRLITGVLLLAVFAFLAIIYCNHAVSKAAEGRLYTDVKEIPYRKTALLLGTSKYVQNGWLNLYYTSRIKAAAALYKAGKIKYIIASGDNGDKNYNEPETMRDDLIAAGVKPSHIYLDYAGFRTFDSIIRLREIFSQDSVTVISQPFHNERALYIASHEGIDAIGFNAKDVTGKAGMKVQTREKLARVKLFVDMLTGKEPRFLGQKVAIPNS